MKEVIGMAKIERNFHIFIFQVSFCAKIQYHAIVFWPFGISKRLANLDLVLASIARDTKWHLTKTKNRENQ